MTRRSDRFALLACAAALAALLLPVPGWSQAVDIEAVAPEPAEQRYSFFTGYDHMFETDVAGGGDVSRDSFAAGAGGRLALGETVDLDTRFIYELNGYDVSNAASPLAWGNVHQYTLASILAWKLDPKWSLLGGPIFRFAGEGSAAFDNGFSGGGLLGFRFSPSKDLSLGLGIGVVSQIEDDAGIIPIPMLRWHFVEPLTLNVGISQLGGRTGLGPELTWHIAEQFDLGAGIQYQRRRFRLDDHGANRKGVGEDTSAPLYLRLSWNPMPEASLELFTGVVAAGELKLQDRDGNQTYDRGYDATPQLGLRGVYRF
jgi:hypothetical protein